MAANWTKLVKHLKFPQQGHNGKKYGSHKNRSLTFLDDLVGQSQDHN